MDCPIADEVSVSIVGLLPEHLLNQGLVRSYKVGHPRQIRVVEERGACVFAGQLRAKFLRPGRVGSAHVELVGLLGSHRERRVAGAQAVTLLLVGEAMLGAVGLSERGSSVRPLQRLLLRLVRLRKRFHAAVVRSVHLDRLFLIRTEDLRRLHGVQLSLGNLGNQLNLVRVLALGTLDLAFVIGRHLQLDRKPTLVRKWAHPAGPLKARLAVRGSVVATRLLHIECLAWLLHLGAAVGVVVGQASVRDVIVFG